MSYTITTVPTGCYRKYDTPSVIEIDPLTGRRFGTVKWHLPNYGDLAAALTSIGGTSQTFSGVYGTAARIVRIAHPDDQGMFAVNAKTRPNGSSGDSVMYSFAEIEVEYATPTYSLSGDAPFLSFSNQGSANAYSIPGSAIRTSDGYALNQDAYITIGECQFSVTIHGAPSINLPAYLTAMENPVNSASFYTPYGSVDPGYVRFDGFSNPAQITLGGIVTNEITLTFSIRTRLTWNQILHPITGLPDTPTFPGGSNLYGTSDLNTLFMTSG